MKETTHDMPVEKRTIEVIGRQTFHRNGHQLIRQRIVKMTGATENGIDRNVSQNPPTSSNMANGTLVCRDRVHACDLPWSFHPANKHATLDKITRESSIIL